jgi:hypothetical protein
METDDGGHPQHGGGEHVSAAPLGNVILTRGRFNTHLESIKIRIVTVKQEPADYMDTDGGSGSDLTDEVFYIGGTGPFAREDEGEGEEDDILDDVSEKLLDSSSDPDEPRARKKNSAPASIGSGTKRAASDEMDFDMGPSYRTIRAARKAASCLRQLNPAPIPAHNEFVSTGSFCTMGDDRIRLTNIEHDLKNRSTKTFSMDTRSGQCSSCLVGAHAAWAARDGGPICVAISDQNFPAWGKDSG